MLLLGQQYIKLTSLSLNHKFSQADLEKSHEKSHEMKKACIGWSIPVIIFQNPFGLFLFGTNRDRKNSDPVVLSKFGLKS